MAWIGVSLEDTLLNDAQPTTGAIEAMTNFLKNGHRVTIISSQFAPTPTEYRNLVKQHIEQTLQTVGVPFSDIWTGTYKPDCDLFIDKKAITFDNDWGMVIAQTNMMLNPNLMEQV